MKLWPLIALLAASCVAAPALSAQAPNRITAKVDSAQLRVSAQSSSPLGQRRRTTSASRPADLSPESLTLVLSRSPQQEQASEQFLADQQNPASPNYHHWLTPAEVGERFGLSDQDIATITDWLQSQGLHVNWVAPSRIFIGFGGTGRQHRPRLPDRDALLQRPRPAAPLRQLRPHDPRGPRSPPSKPFAASTPSTSSPTTHDQRSSNRPRRNSTGSNGSHFITPGDFNTIYDVSTTQRLPATPSASSVGRAPTSPTLTTSKAWPESISSTPLRSFPPPTAASTQVPPSPLRPPASVSIGGQAEATLDVLRAGSVAPAPHLLLVFLLPPAPTTASAPMRSTSSTPRPFPPRS